MGITIDRENKNVVIDFDWDDLRRHREEELRVLLESLGDGGRVIMTLNYCNRGLLDNPAVVSRLCTLRLNSGFDLYMLGLQDVYARYLARNLPKATRLTCLLTHQDDFESLHVVANVILACKESLRELVFSGLPFNGHGYRYLAEAVLQVKGLQSLRVDNPLPDGYSSDFWATLFSHVSHLTELRHLGGASVTDVDLGALATLTKLTHLVAYRAPYVQIGDTVY
jgi:hypothetical protein